MSGERTALVTGSAKRLGRHLTERLAAAGWRVLVHYRSSAAEAELVAAGIRSRGGRARVVAGDVSVRADVERIFASIAEVEGRLDLLVNNVGVYVPKPLVEVTPDDWDHHLRVNLDGAFYCCHAARPLLEASGGSIVNIGYAGVDALRADVDATPYQVGKTGLLVLTKSLGKALASRGVRVNMVSPGQLANSVDLPEDLAAAIPAGRAGTLDDVADAVEWLVGADYVTGVNIDVAGGYRL